MYAIIQNGGKQYRAEPGATITVDRLHLEPGDSFETNDVLLWNNDGQVQIGKPKIESVKVSGTVLDNPKGNKIVVFKMKRRKGYRKKQGYRHKFTRIKIETIENVN